MIDIFGMKRLKILNILYFESYKKSDDLTFSEDYFFHLNFLFSSVEKGLVIAVNTSKIKKNGSQSMIPNSRH